MTKTTDVEIYGQRYTVRGEADEGYIRRLAAFVDGQMRQVAEGMNTTTPSRLAVHVTGWFGEFTAIWLDASK